MKPKDIEILEQIKLSKEQELIGSDDSIENYNDYTFINELPFAINKQIDYVLSRHHGEAKKYLSVSLAEDGKPDTKKRNI